MRCSLAGLLALCLLLPVPEGTPPKQEPPLKPFNLDKVNTEADEVDPFLAPDGMALYYASNASGTFDILVSRRPSAASTWPGGKRLRLNAKDADARSPFVRGITLYYATNKVPDKKLENLQNFDLWKRIGPRAPLPLLGVSEKEDELSPWITPKGDVFYFSRKTEEGWRVFAARGPEPGPIGNAKAVELPAGFHHATVDAKGLVMYLQGPLEKDRWGLFRTTRAKVGMPWAKPEPLTRLNHPEGQRGDLCPSLSADGKKLYFASDRPGGKGGLDLWMIPTAQLKGKAK
jgi:hypothetical protein